MSPKNVTLSKFVKHGQPKRTPAVVTDRQSIAVGTALSRDESKACPLPGASNESGRR